MRRILSIPWSSFDGIQSIPTLANKSVRVRKESSLPRGEGKGLVLVAVAARQRKDTIFFFAKVGPKATQENMSNE